MSIYTYLPYIKLEISVCETDFRQFGHSLPQESSCRLRAISDTGALICQAGTSLLTRLSLNKTDLLPTNMMMCAANSKEIPFLGALLLRFRGMDKTGNSRETRQVTYITDSCQEVLLSKEACQDLGMISQEFPQITTKTKKEVNLSTRFRNYFQRFKGSRKHDFPCHNTLDEEFQEENPIETIVDGFKYDASIRKWKKTQCADKARVIELKVSNRLRYIQELGYSRNTKKTWSKIAVLPDTGCTHCLAGEFILKILDLEVSDLMPTNMEIYGANMEPMEILGAAVLQYQGKDAFGRLVSTEQLTFIAKNTNRFVLSKTACQELGLISAKFPRIGEFLDQN